LTTKVTFGGGGVGIFGEGASGAADLSTYNQQGNPGSGGNNKTYGGGGSGAEDDSAAGGGDGGSGYVYIIWTDGSIIREFPSTNVGAV
jgi:hypothetical protein